MDVENSFTKMYSLIEQSASASSVSSLSLAASLSEAQTAASPL